MQTSVECDDLNIIKYVNSILFIICFASKAWKKSCALYRPNL